MSVTVSISLGLCDSAQHGLGRVINSQGQATLGVTLSVGGTNGRWTLIGGSRGW